LEAARLSQCTALRRGDVQALKGPNSDITCNVVLYCPNWRSSCVGTLQQRTHVNTHCHNTFKHTIWGGEESVVMYFETEHEELRRNRETEQKY
jgi:hypothetical protein